MLRTLAAAVIVLGGGGAIGCASAAAPGDIDAEQTETAEAALAGGFTTPPPPPPRRRLVRVGKSSCEPVVGSHGSWIGARLGARARTSGAFCAYAWNSGASPDAARLESVALPDGRRGGRYSVPDPRASNGPLPAAELTPVLAVGGGPLGFVGTTPGPTPRIGGCEVCVSWEGSYLYAVLPPEARPDTVYLHAGSSTYAVGGGPGVAWYAAVPGGFAGTPYLTYITW